MPRAISSVVILPSIENENGTKGGITQSDCGQAPPFTLLPPRITGTSRTSGDLDSFWIEAKVISAQRVRRTPPYEPSM